MSQLLQLLTPRPQPMIEYARLVTFATAEDDYPDPIAAKTKKRLAPKSITARILAAVLDGKETADLVSEEVGFSRKYVTRRLHYLVRSGKLYCERGVLATTFFPPGYRVAAASFEVGDEVKWACFNTKKGRFERVGKVHEIVPVGEMPKSKSPARSAKHPRKTDSYIIDVGVRPDTRMRYYWPYVDSLERA